MCAMHGILSFVFVVSVSGCALFGGGEEKINRAKNYRVTPPKDWKEIDSSNQSDQAYKLPSGNVVTLTSSCKPNRSQSLDVLTRHLLLGARNVSYEKQDIYLIAGHEGLYSSVKAKMEGVPFSLELFVLPSNTCVFDFSLMSPKMISETDKADFISFFKSFKNGTN
jgi:hypothetical protein